MNITPPSHTHLSHSISILLQSPQRGFQPPCSLPCWGKEKSSTVISLLCLLLTHCLLEPACCMTTLSECTTLVSTTASYTNNFPTPPHDNLPIAACLEYRRLFIPLLVTKVPLCHKGLGKVHHYYVDQNYSSNDI